MPNIRNVKEIVESNGFSDLTDAEHKTIIAFVVTNDKNCADPKYLEVGVFGGGTIFKLKNLTSKTHFTGVDLFEDFEVSNDNTHKSGTYPMTEVSKLLGTDRVNLIKGDSTKVLPTLTDKFDFIFIDGNHSYKGTMDDFDNAVKLLAPNGQIAFHNCSVHMFPDPSYIQDDGGPWKVVQDLKMTQEWQCVSEIERIAVFKKRKV